jgi:hypothetical protein
VRSSHSSSLPGANRTAKARWITLSVKNVSVSPGQSSPEHKRDWILSEPPRRSRGIRRLGTGREEQLRSRIGEYEKPALWKASRSQQARAVSV